MATNDQQPPAHKLADMGLIDTVSMWDFTPDQRLIDAALKKDEPTRQQGGSFDKHSSMPGGACQPGTDRGTVSHWRDPWGTNK